MKNKSVLVVGSANMDMVVQVDHYPRPGETIFGKNFGMYPGGKGANQAVACAKLSAETIFLGKMGQDLFKDRLLDNMRSNGVIMDGLLIDPVNPTGIALIYVNSAGQNEIVVVSGSNMNLTPMDILAKAALFEQSSLVLTQLEIPIETVMEAARLTRECGGLFFLNPAPAAMLPEELVGLIDFLTPNEIELSMLTGVKVIDERTASQAAGQLIEKGIGNVIVTMGAKGALWVHESTTRFFHSYKVKSVDTTAAGDAFNGAFANGLANGKTVSEAIDFANRAAAITVTRPGAQPSMPILEEIDMLSLK